MSLISVIMPVYNAELFLKEAIQSILNQTHNNFELIILNDCSTDKSKNIIEEFVKKDNRILFINKLQNNGPAKLRNEGIKIAKGEYIALMDADDIALSTRFEKQLKIFKQNNEIGVCGSWFTTFGNKIKGKTIKHAKDHDEIKARFLIDCTIGNSTAMFRKNILDTIIHNENYEIAIDYEFWSRLINKTKFHNIQESLLKYRVHNNNISVTKAEKLNAAKIDIKNIFLNLLEIEFNDLKNEDFTNLLESNQNLTNNQINKIINCGLVILTNNKKTNTFNEFYLKKTIYYLTTRALKKSKKINLKTIKFIKIKNPEYYNSLNIKNKTKLYIKALLSLL